MRLRVEKNKAGLRGTIEIPADKSITHRAFMFSGLIKGKNIVKNFSKGGDCLSTLEVLKSLGAEVKYLGDKELLIDSSSGFSAPSGELFCGNSGTTMRLMSGILAGQKFDSVLTGDESLSKRPMGRVISPLKLMGAEICSTENKAPLRISGRNLKGIEYVSPLASAQVKSCVLLAGMHAEGKTVFEEPYVSRNHTERMLEYLGAEISVDKSRVGIERCELIPKEINVAGDISSAAFFIVAALIVPDSDIVIKNVGLNPTRSGILDVISQMGADYEILDERIDSNEEVGDIRVKYSSLKGTIIQGELIPRLIDELPVLAVLASRAEGKTVVKDAKDLRNKESDRISSLAQGLKKLGVQITEREDGFEIEGKTSLKGGCELETFHDHRLAMSFYVAGLICQESILINGFEWTNISFPEFEKLMWALQS